MNKPDESNDNKPRRRVRYSGTHPKKFSQKYKERNIDSHPALRTHLRARGKTPAGTHIPVLTDEIIAFLKPSPGSIVVDCTLGYGGHAKQLIKRIGPDGLLIGIDRDGDELKKTRKRFSKAKAKISFHHSNFAGVSKIITEVAPDGCDIIFADIGVSSMQVDNPDRGISYKNDGPLDMRMDKRLKSTGSDLLASLSREELSAALWEFSDEPAHELIAQMLVNQRKAEPITQVSQLVRLVFAVKGFTVQSWKKQQKDSRFSSLHPAARTFQALRILVNDELGALKELLRTAPDCLRPGGRVGIISFHSGEDRLVKRAFRQGVADGVYSFAEKNAITPRRKEIQANPRSSSAKFRWAVKA
ncbi:MAG: 16S rRNA (cytosine(1402)-N(4))-methyltransferase RsmH [Anaerohalosphaeraceae bacterium]|nr:16S rRNA (cytosine(1402)-N(4))-methyltransferase RsmH [Anaerohalosphaeraceae bacterium]